MALAAFIDLHIANPSLSLDRDAWDAALEAQEPDESVLAALQSRVMNYQAGAKGAHMTRLQRRMRDLAISPPAQSELRAGGGLETVEHICGWVERKRAYGKRYEVFHEGVAGLTQQECRVLELSQRYLDGRGRPDFARICTVLDPGSQRTHEVNRKTAGQTLRRAREKVQAYLRRTEQELVTEGAS